MSMQSTRKRLASRSFEVHTSCAHADSYWDRFGCEVCADCHETLAVGVCEPNEGCGERVPYRRLV